MWWNLLLDLMIVWIYLQESVQFRASFMGPLPLQEYYELIDAHFTVNIFFCFFFCWNCDYFYPSLTTAQINACCSLLAAVLPRLRETSEFGAEKFGLSDWFISRARVYVQFFVSFLKGCQPWEYYIVMCVCEPVGQVIIKWACCTFVTHSNVVTRQNIASC